MDAVISALSDATRRGMLDRLREGPATAGELAAGLPMSQPAASKHLSVLRNAGLVAAETAGRHRLYRLAPEPLAEVEQWLTPYRALWTQRMDALTTEIARGKKNRTRAETAPHTEESA